MVLHSISQQQIKAIRSLRQKKFRLSEGLFIVEGEKSVSDFLHSPLKVKKIITTNEIPLPANIPATTELLYAKLKEYERITTLKTPPGLMAVVEIPKRQLNLNHLGPLTLMLDNLNDPGNLGTIIRTADWFGIKHIICSENTVDAYNPKTVQATMGSLSRVTVFYRNLTEILTKIPNTTEILALDMEGTPIKSHISKKSKILITGNESKGLSPYLHQYIDNKISIPLSDHQKNNKPESLNASVATAIACYELSQL
jgi:TrmH family RNA methyltransferase